LPRRGRVGDDSTVPDDAAQNSDQPAEIAQLRAELAAAEARIAALEQMDTSGNLSPPRGDRDSI
jgi:hypothetical protein